MKSEIPIRIRVNRPLAGVAMQVQRGREELLPPKMKKADAIEFEFTVTVDLTETVPNFLGKYTQGPKDQRFIYVNSGSYAGIAGTGWDRRAKVSLMNVTREQIEAVLAKPGTLLEAEFEGIGRDGGPTCASVKGVEWKVKNK
mgnify:CR=1 FL=1